MKTIKFEITPEQFNVLADLYADRGMSATATAKFLMFEGLSKVKPAKNKDKPAKLTATAKRRLEKYPTLQDWADYRWEMFYSQHREYASVRVSKRMYDEIIEEMWPDYPEIVDAGEYSQSVFDEHFNVVNHD